VKIETPLFDAWLAQAAKKLSRYGAKAELADHLSARYGRPKRSWERYLSDILRRAVLPNAEVHLAIDAWLQKSESP
jgi:hypothetical protein